ncbi:hypothetical protein [Xenorhabdus japonica]|uniref:Uncharacterized protein n=1 Tax=Xenorhabdus japonica TaxID=53341 RepID=A0A1I5EC56_9GAMM|nr:hypothetical protein [Xenorhabdus japonica]SFO08970.1 hypothetical protein SAMN05421579_1626 [Xenorhabdus japonica]
MKNKELGLLPLTGTEKQVAWAENIRSVIISMLVPYDEFVNSVDEFDEYDLRRVKTRAWADNLVDSLLTGLAKEKYSRVRIGDNELNIFTRAFLDAIKQKSHASWWIDNRESSLSTIIHELRDEILAVEITCENYRHSVFDESTIQPENPVEKISTLVTAYSDEVHLEFDGDNGQFIQIVHSYGFKYKDGLKKWILRIKWDSGDSKDRAAEIIHALLKNGFPVSTINESIRKMAINASFEPKYPRWIYFSVRSNNKNYVFISWNDKANLTKEIKMLDGAIESYARPNLWKIRVEQWASIRDFAEIHRFKITSEAEAQLKMAENKEKSRLIVGSIPEPKNHDLLPIENDSGINGIHKDLIDDE